MKNWFTSGWFMVAMLLSLSMGLSLWLAFSDTSQKNKLDRERNYFIRDCAEHRSLADCHKDAWELYPEFKPKE